MASISGRMGQLHPQIKRIRNLFFDNTAPGLTFGWLGSLELWLAWVKRSGRISNACHARQTAMRLRWGCKPQSPSRAHRNQDIRSDVWCVPKGLRPLRFEEHQTHLRKTSMRMHPMTNGRAQLGGHKWAGELRYVRTREGWWYQTVILDPHVAWSTSATVISQRAKKIADRREAL